MPTRAMSLGWRGEAAARAWLEQRGFVFLAQHFRTRAGEIDLVMQDDRHLVFVEVKTRRSRRFGVPEESVTEWKLERLQAAAEVWLQRHPWSGPVRFDLVVEENGAIRHLRGIG